LDLRGPTSKGREGAEGKRGGDKSGKGRGKGARTPSMINLWLRHSSSAFPIQRLLRR